MHNCSACLFTYSALEIFGQNWGRQKNANLNLTHIKQEFNMNLKFIWIKCEDCVTFKTALKPVSTGEPYRTICPMSKFSPLSSTRPGVGYHKRKRYFFSWEELDWGRQTFAVLTGWQVGIAECRLCFRGL